MWIVSNRKIIRIPESGKILLMEAGIRGCFACGIQHPANNWNSESKFPLTRNPKFNFCRVRNSQRGIQNARLSWINGSLYPDLNSTSDWSCGEGNLLQPIRSTTHIREVLLIGRAAWEIFFNQSEALLWSGQWHVISLEFLRLFLRRLFEVKPLVASRTVSQVKLWPKNGCEGDYVVAKSLFFLLKLCKR